MRAGERNRGRRLLALRNLIESETDPARIMKLRKEEACLYSELGNPPQARTAAESLLADYPDWPAGHAAAADIACRAGRWAEAERLFARAAELNEAAGRPDASDRLRTGPLYRLAEARGDFAACRALCAGGGELASVLAARASRLLAGHASLPGSCSEPLARHLLLLERSWSGDTGEDLLEEALTWGAPEPEWRWRFVVEGLELHASRGGAPSDWRRPVAETSSPVLDPRFGRERARLASLVGLR